MDRQRYRQSDRLTEDYGEEQKDEEEEEEEEGVD